MFALSNRSWFYRYITASGVQSQHKKEMCDCSDTHEARWHFCAIQTVVGSFWTDLCRKSFVFALRSRQLCFTSSAAAAGTVMDVHVSVGHCVLRSYKKVILCWWCHGLCWMLVSVLMLLVPTSELVGPWCVHCDAFMLVYFPKSRPVYLLNSEKTNASSINMIDQRGTCNGGVQSGYCWNTREANTSYADKSVVEQHLKRKA